MGVGRGYGKTILIGDQFVLWGIPAVLAAIPFETVCTVTRIDHGTGWTLNDRRTEVPGYKAAKAHDCQTSFNRMIEVLGIDVDRTPIHIDVEGDLLAGSGVGASAAICVSFARAVNDEFNLGLDIIDINRVAWEGEFGYHGLPSGVDNTVSTFGGVIRYQIDAGEKRFTRLPLHEPIEIVLGNSGITSNTASLKGFLEQQERDNPQRFEARLTRVRSHVEQLESALSAGDLATTGKIMDANHDTLIEMGLSHPRLVELCDHAKRLGAFGAKVTGGGRGGYMVALTPGKTLQDTVASAFEQAGVATIRATIGNPPTDGRESCVVG